MKRVVAFIKSVFIRGIFILIPLLIFFIVVEKAYHIVKRLAKPIGRLFPAEAFLSVPVQELIAVLLLILICILAGLLAKANPGINQWLIAGIENKVLVHLPGYSLMKAMGEQMTGVSNKDERLVVMVRFDDAYQIGFLMEKIENADLSAVYIPGTPNPWTGSLYFFTNNRLQHLNISYSEAMACIKQGGLGTNDLMRRSAELKQDNNTSLK